MLISQIHYGAHGAKIQLEINQISGETILFMMNHVRTKAENTTFSYLVG